MPLKSIPEIKKCDSYRIIHQLVQIRRIELLRREAQDSKSCVSTSSTISAKQKYYKVKQLICLTLSLYLFLKNVKY